MATAVKEFLQTRTGGFVAGLAIGTGVFLAVRFGPRLIFSFVLTKLPAWTGRQIASAIVNDVAIGRIPVLVLEEAVTVRTVVASTITVAFWLFQGFGTLIEFGKQQLGIPLAGTGRPHEIDTPNPDPIPWAWIITSRNGQLQVKMPNMSLVDP